MQINSLQIVGKSYTFNNFFVAQCQPFQNASKLPEPRPLTRAKLDTFEITSEQVSNILAGLKVKKAHGPDDISVNMIMLWQLFSRATKANFRQHPKNNKISKAMEDS